MGNKIKYPRYGIEKICRAEKPTGKQRYKYKECEREFITDLNYSKDFKEKQLQYFTKGTAAGQ